MKLSQLFERLEKSPAYKNFKKTEESENAFFCAGFFLLNIKKQTSEYSLDFRNEKEIFSFKMQEKEVILAKEDIIEGRKQLEKIEESEAKKISTDINDIKNLAESEMKKNKINNALEEIIVIFQKNPENNALEWHLTCIAEAFTIVNMIINADSGKILGFEKKNLLDFVSIKKPEKK